MEGGALVSPHPAQKPAWPVADVIVLVFCAFHRKDSFFPTRYPPFLVTLAPSKNFLSFSRALFAILQNGGIRAVPDLRYHLRDYQPVRALPVAPPSVLLLRFAF